MEESASEGSGLAGLSTANEGIREVMQREFVVCINHSPDLRHPSKPIMTLKAGSGVIGQEVWEENQIAKLSADPNMVFLGRNFVLFRDRLDTARGKSVRFVFEPQSFPELDDVHGVCKIVSATISPITDVYIKRRAGWNTAHSDQGTVLIGFNLCQKKA